METGQKHVACRNVFLCYELNTAKNAVDVFLNKMWLAVQCHFWRIQNIILGHSELSENAALKYAQKGNPMQDIYKLLRGESCICENDV